MGGSGLGSARFWKGVWIAALPREERHRGWYATYTDRELDRLLGGEVRAASLNGSLAAPFRQLYRRVREHDPLSQVLYVDHKLSLADHSRERRGVLLARVTSDVETVSRFVEWGAMTWAMNVSVIAGAFVVMAVYSWQLTLVAIATMATVVPAVRFIHGRQLRAYRQARTAVGDLLSVFNETLSGSDAIRSYGYMGRARSRIAAAIDARFRADLRTARYTAVLFTVGDFIGAVTMAVVALAAVQWGPGWGLGAGEVISFFFLVSLVQTPIGEITEVLEDTQTAVAGWDKVLTLLTRNPSSRAPRTARPCLMQRCPSSSTR